MNDEVRIFISYAREDQDQVKALYHDLVAAGYHPWLDREHIMPGQRWEPVIKQALKQSHFVLVCLSATSINKRGFLQTEIKQALEQAKEKLEDDVWLIPARLADCEVPKILSDIQWVDLFENDGLEQLLRALAFQLQRQGVAPAKAAPARVTPPTTQPVVVRQPVFDFISVKLDDRGNIVERKPGQAHGYIEDLGGGVNLEMIEIAGGEFWMGSTDAEAQSAFAEAKRHYDQAQEKWYKAEAPRHRVKVSPFSMGRHPVTQSQWYEVVGDLPEIEDKLRGDAHPVVNVSWDEAVEFCKELSRRTGRQYRLPTEAEWEFACRAGTSTPFAFGPALSPEVANYWWSHPYANGPKKEPLQKTIAVGSLGVANAFGLSDMHGNVWEWCSDWYSESYHQECRAQGVVNDPQGPGSGSYRVSRGGGWASDAVYCRSAYRYGDAPGYRYGYLGFRLVRIGR